MNVKDDIKWILPWKAIHIICWGVLGGVSRPNLGRWTIFFKFQSLSIHTILSYRLQKLNSVCKQRSWKRNFSISFYFHGLFGTFSQILEFCEMVWYCLFKDNGRTAKPAFSRETLRDSADLITGSSRGARNHVWRRREIGRISWRQCQAQTERNRRRGKQFVLNTSQVYN